MSAPAGEAALPRSDIERLAVLEQRASDARSDITEIRSDVAAIREDLHQLREAAHTGWNVLLTVIRIGAFVAAVVSSATAAAWWGWQHVKIVP